ncbi:MAG: hypothetical protein K0B06_13045 [Brevefilum sp.]|nr:hypothetical protein [Brevefilum sp.]
MPKQFYTERDIEDLAARGVFTLTVCDDVVLTELAFEKAERLGVKLVQTHPQPPAAPVRPYLSQPVTPTAAQIGSTAAPSLKDDEALRQRIRSAVKAKLGNEIDSPLLESIITRVLDNIGAK